MKNKILIKLAVILLRLVNKSKLEYRNTFEHLINQIDSYLTQ